MNIFPSAIVYLLAYCNVAGSQPTPKTLWTTSISTDISRTPRDVFFSPGDSTLFVFSTMGWDFYNVQDGTEKQEPFIAPNATFSSTAPASIHEVNPLTGVISSPWEVPPSAATNATPHGISSVDFFPRDGSPLQQIVFYTNDSIEGIGLGRVIAYSPAANSLLWDFELNGSAQSGAYGAGKPSISYDGTAVYACQATGLVVRINMATGLPDWQEDIGLPNLKGVVSSPDGTRVYASSSGPNRIIEIDATDGTVLATGDLGGEPRVEPLPTKKGDCVYLQNEVTGMQCFDPNDIAGGAVWTSLVSGGTSSQYSSSRPALSDDMAAIYASAHYDTGRLSSDGASEWVRGGPNFHDADMKLSPDQAYLYTANSATISTMDGHVIRKLDSNTGDVEWLLEERGPLLWSKEVSAEFSLSGDGSILFYGLEDGTIRALNTTALVTDPPSTPPTPVPTASPSTAPTQAPSPPPTQAPSPPVSSPTASPATSAPVDSPTNAPGSYAAHINVLSSLIIGFAAIAALA